MTTYGYRLLINIETDEIGRCLKNLRFRDEASYQPTDLMVETWHGDVEAMSIMAASEAVFAIHNRDDRPTGQICPSMSMGDVVILETRPRPTAYAVAMIGFIEVPVPTNLYHGTYLEFSDALPRCS